MGKLFGTPMPGREPEKTSTVNVEGVMSEVTSLLGVSAVLIVDENGEVIHQWYRTLLDRSRMEIGGSEIRDLVKSTVDFVGRLGGGAMDNMILRSDTSTVLVQIAGKQALFIFADKRANLALLIIRAKRVAQIILTGSPPRIQ